MKRTTLLLLTVLLSFGAVGANAEEKNDIFSKVVGTWEWADRVGTAESNPHTIKFVDENKAAVFSLANPIKSQDGTTKRSYTYKVLYSGEHSITMFLDGETRKTDAGDLVIWVLMLKTPDVYCWRRTDWPPQGCTKEVRRVKP